MSTAILVIWTIVAVQGYYGDRPQHDWRALGEFNSDSHCEAAAQRLALTKTTYRCIATGKAR